ncbi:hypothetical protein ACIQ9K_39110 [Streptomyces microflavus]|uniref:hypothetical protein n=1 Tax=Streptomyces microflavus TaxID=1919 RepID=UPI0038160551
MEISDASATAQARARTWTKVHQHLGSAPGAGQFGDLGSVSQCPVLVQGGMPESFGQ